MKKKLGFTHFKSIDQRTSNSIIFDFNDHPFHKKDEEINYDLEINSIQDRTTIETSSTDDVTSTLRNTPTSVSPLGTSTNIVYKVGSYYFKDIHKENFDEKKLILDLNSFIADKLGDLTVHHTFEYTLLEDLQEKFDSPKQISPRLFVQTQIDDTFKSISIETISDLLNFYDPGLKDHFQRALLHTILTGQYDEHAGNILQNPLTKEIKRFDLDLSFSGGEFILSKETDLIFTGFGLRSILLMILDSDYTLLVDQPLSEDIKSSLRYTVNQDFQDFDLENTALASRFDFARKNFSKIVDFLDSNMDKPVTILDILTVCYPFVARTLTSSKTKLDQAQATEDSKQKHVLLTTWFRSVSECFNDIWYFEDMYRYDKFHSQKEKNIEEAIAKGKPEEEIRELVKKRDDELEPKKKELMQYEISFRQTFLLNVTTTAKKVAEEYKVDVVLDKQVIYHGGYDLTDLVLNQLNK